MQDIYQSPLVSRYATREMLRLFSPVKRTLTWRRLWVALAKAQMMLGLPITNEQVDELIANIEILMKLQLHKKNKKCVMMSWRIFMGMDSCAQKQKA